MIVGLSAWMNRSRPSWMEEFQRACAGLGWEARVVDVHRDRWMEDAGQADLFVWRPAMGDPSEMAEIRTKLPLIEALGIPCFPNSLMLWLYDDKIRETFFMRQRGIPTPKTFVSFDAEEARAFARIATYPLVAKTHAGASSNGVIKLKSPKEALRLLDKVFRAQSILDKALVKYWFQPRLAKGNFLLERRFRFRDHCPRYAYFQEFIPAQADWRITTLGRDLVSVFVRRNRTGDFRASGSGVWEMAEAHGLPADACDLALDISNRYGFTSMAYDFLKSPSGWVIGELSMTFVLNDVYARTLFRRTPSGYEKEAPIPIGIMHLRALQDAAARKEAIPKWPLS